MYANSSCDGYARKVIVSTTAGTAKLAILKSAIIAGSRDTSLVRGKESGIKRSGSKLKEVVEDASLLM